MTEPGLLFETESGWCSLLFSEGALIGFSLPSASLEEQLAISHKKSGVAPRIFYVDNKQACLSPGQELLIRQIQGYFRGEEIRNWAMNPDISALSPFQRRVLTAVEMIPYGKVQTYGDIAALCGQSGAARAIGQVLKINPVPLIIPCHRVVAKKGLGGFTATGGVDLKSKMLALEKCDMASSRLQSGSL